MTDQLKLKSRGQARRQLLKFAVAAPAVWCGRGWAGASDGVGQLPERTLSLVNTHTGESLVARYFAAGSYLSDALARLNILLRDHRCGAVSTIDPQLFDLLHTLAVRADREPHFEVISGYRSPASNALLHSHSSGVARHSLHMQGKAIDVRLSGVPCAQLRDLALSAAFGGVGYYRKSGFVHLDTGRFRSWSG